MKPTLKIQNLCNTKIKTFEIEFSRGSTKNFASKITLITP